MQYIEDEITPELEGITVENMMEKLVVVWEKYTMYTMLVNRLFDYIDRNYIMQNNLETMGFWCQLIFKSEVIEGRAVSIEDSLKFGHELQKLILRDRKGE